MQQRRYAQMAQARALAEQTDSGTAIASLQKGHSLQTRPTQDHAYRLEKGKSVPRTAAANSTLSGMTGKKCTDSDYTKYGICANYLECKDKHPWDSKFGDKNDALIAYRNLKGLPPPR